MVTCKQIRLSACTAQFFYFPDMIFYSLFTQIYLYADLFVSQTLRKKMQNFLFFFGQGIKVQSMRSIIAVVGNFPQQKIFKPSRERIAASLQFKQIFLKTVTIKTLQ